MAVVDWEGLGRAVRRRRVELGHITIASFAEVVGLSTRIVGDIEGGRRPSYDPATLDRIEQTLKWPPGHIESILRGTKPVHVHATPAQTTLSGVGVLMADAEVTPGLPLELAHLIGPDSPLPPEQREELATIVDRVLQPYRRAARRQDQAG